MKTFKFFLGGFLAAITLVILSDLLAERRDRNQTPPPPTPQIVQIEVTPSPDPLQQLLTLGGRSEARPNSPTKTQPTDPLTSALYQQSSSDEIAAIEQDINHTDLTSLDLELTGIETAYAKLGT